MAQYSSAYTTSTTDITAGTETYKFSRVVSTVNPSEMDNSCIYCGAENPVQYDYYPTNMYSGSQLTAMNSKWEKSGSNFNFTKHTKDTSFNICFTLCDYAYNTEESGRNSVYQIGKQIYNESSAESSSNIRVLNPVDIRKLIFYPQFNGFEGASMSSQSVDLKYLIEHKDTFFVNSMTMNSYIWNGSNFTSTPTRLNRIRPCIVGNNYFLPLMTVLANHVFQTTDYNSRKAYSTSFFGAYDSDGMGIDFFPIMSDESLAFTTEPTTTNLISPNGNKFNCNYNYYISEYKLYSPASIVLKLLAHCGCYFMDNSYNLSGKTLNTMWNDEHIYLGEMKEGARTTGNFIKGTDLLISDTINKGAYSSETDFDPTPTPPPGPGPYDDDPWSGVSFSGVGVGGPGAFARCYYMTNTELSNLRSSMSGINVPEGFDPMAQIIGLSQVPVALSGDAPETVKFINSSAVYDPGVTTREVDSNVSTQLSMGMPIKYELGSVDIDRRMQERGEPYLDYSCQIELYLPLIGMFSLDTQTVMGRTIEAEAVLDPVSGTLAAYAWVIKDGEKLPIAYGSTTISVDLPVTAQQYSVAKAALKQANAQLATSLLSSALTMVASASASGKAAANSNGRATAASGMRNAREGFNSFTNAASIAASQTMVSQTGSVFGSFMDWGRTIRQLSYGNNTAISGSFGGSTAQWSYPFTAYVKIIRPRFEKPLNYAHTQGIPCIQAKKVGKCTGFIQCVGVDVSGITRATDIERQAIQAALSNGVYAGGGE